MYPSLNFGSMDHEKMEKNIDIYGPLGVVFLEFVLCLLFEMGRGLIWGIVGCRWVKVWFSLGIGGGDGGWDWKSK